MTAYLKQKCVKIKLINCNFNDNKYANYSLSIDRISLRLLILFTLFDGVLEVGFSIMLFLMVYCRDGSIMLFLMVYCRDGSVMLFLMVYCSDGSIMPFLM